MVAPTREQRSWTKNTQLIVCTLEDVRHPMSSNVGPRKATHMPKLQNTAQYVIVACQCCMNSLLQPMANVCFSVESGPNTLRFTGSLSALDSVLISILRPGFESVPLASLPSSTPIVFVSMVAAPQGWHLRKSRPAIQERDRNNQCTRC